MRESSDPLDSQFSDVGHLQTPHQPEISLNTQADAIELSTQSQHSNLDQSPLRATVLDWLQQNVPDSRLQHILRVEAMAVDLAKLHQVNVEQAAQAGLMHDVAKFFKPDHLLRLARTEGLELDPVELANPHLLHAEVGAIVARDEFGVHDQAVLQAIRNHTLGLPGMSPLSCVVFLADSLEPGRGDTPELKVLRQASQQDLHRAVWLTCNDSIRYLIAHHQLIHPRAVLTRNWAMTAGRKE